MGGGTNKNRHNGGEENWTRKLKRFSRIEGKVGSRWGEACLLERRRGRAESFIGTSSIKRPYLGIGSGGGTMTLFLGEMIKVVFQVSGCWTRGGWVLGSDLEKAKVVLFVGHMMKACDLLLKVLWRTIS